MSKFNTGSLLLRGILPVKTKNKHHIFACAAGAHCSIFPKLCMMIELVVPVIKAAIHFLIQRIVYPTRYTEKLGIRVISQQ